MAGFWKAPRVLAGMLAQGELTPSQYALLNFVCQSGADRPGGYLTTNGLLASVLDLHERTVRRALRELRARDLIAFDDHQRIPHFTIHAADTLRTLEGVSMSEGMSEGMSAGLRTPPLADAPLSGTVEPETGVPSCGHGSGTETETEKETETPLKPPRGGPVDFQPDNRRRSRRDRRSNEQVLADVLARRIDTEATDAGWDGRGTA